MCAHMHVTTDLWPTEHHSNVMHCTDLLFVCCLCHHRSVGASAQSGGTSHTVCRAQTVWYTLAVDSSQTKAQLYLRHYGHIFWTGLADGFVPALPLPLRAAGFDDGDLRISARQVRAWMHVYLRCHGRGTDVSSMEQTGCRLSQNVVCRIALLTLAVHNNRFRCACTSTTTAKCRMPALQARTHRTRGAQVFCRARACCRHAVQARLYANLALLSRSLIAIRHCLVQYAVGECNYGGRVTDDKVKRQLCQASQQFLSSGLSIKRQLQASSSQ